MADLTLVERWPCPTPNCGEVWIVADEGAPGYRGGDFSLLVCAKCHADYHRTGTHPPGGKRRLIRESDWNRNAFAVTNRPVRPVTAHEAVLARQQERALLHHAGTVVLSVTEPLLTADPSSSAQEALRLALASGAEELAAVQAQVQELVSRPDPLPPDTTSAELPPGFSIAPPDTLRQDFATAMRNVSSAMAGLCLVPQVTTSAARAALGGPRQELARVVAKLAAAMEAALPSRPQ